MALGKAIQFVRNASKDKSFRMACVGFESKADLLAHHRFDELEFDDAINMQLVNCQTYEEAEVYQQLRFWFAML